MDRREAAAALAERLRGLRAPIVLALAPGGARLGAELALVLDAPLDVLVARAIDSPIEDSRPLGAVAEGGVIVVDEQTLAEQAVPRDELMVRARAELREVERTVARSRGRRLPDRVGRTAVLVDETAGGDLCMLAAVAAMRGRCERIVVAVAVGTPDALDRLREEADDVIALDEPVLERLPDESALVRIPAAEHAVSAALDVPWDPCGLVILADDAGARRFARHLHDARVATLLLEGLSPDPAFLTPRLLAAIQWARRRGELADLRVGLFGMSPAAAAAALDAAALRPEQVKAVASGAGRDFDMRRLAAWFAAELARADQTLRL